jgi:RimJ/RimL family protein N-acetyltransferase
MQHLGGVRDDAQTDAYMTRNLQHWADYGFGLWILHERDGATPIGRAVLRHLLLDGVDEVEVGYAFYPAYWGRGLASEVTRACLTLGRDALGLETIVAVTRASNLASQRVLVKAGLTCEREYLHEGAAHRLYRFWVTPQRAVV